MKLFVMAAGLGSRFGGMKQLAAVGPSGESILEYSIYDALETGYSEIVVIIRPSMTEAFSEVLVSRLPPRARPSVVFQEDPALAAAREKPWGTGHALLCGEEALDSPFVVINADDFYGRAALRIVYEFLEKADPGRPGFCMAGFRLANVLSRQGTVSRGICRVGTDGTLEGLREHKALERRGERIVSHDPEGGRQYLSGDEIVSMNLWGLAPSIFPLARPVFDRFLEENRDSDSAEFYLPHLVQTLVSEGKARVRVLAVEDRPLGLTYREDLEDARESIGKLVEAGRYPSPLWGAGRGPSRLEEP